MKTLIFLSIFSNMIFGDFSKKGISVMRRESPWSVHEDQDLSDQKKSKKKVEIKKTLYLHKKSKKNPLPEENTWKDFKQSNLPLYYQGVTFENCKASGKSVVSVSNTSVKMKGLKSGDVVRAVIDQEITASSTVSSPIIAIATSTRYKGSSFLGEATLDQELKRVLLVFHKLRLKENDQVYSLKAAGVSLSGKVGLTGNYHSESGKFFLAELASALTAGLLDSTINRQQTTFGGYVAEPSLVNSVKTGTVTALSKTADHSAESLRRSPEYTEVDGFQEIKIIIQDDPVEVGS